MYGTRSCLTRNVLNTAPNYSTVHKDKVHRASEAGERHPTQSSRNQTVRTLSPNLHDDDRAEPLVKFSSACGEANEWLKKKINLLSIVRRCHLYLWRKTGPDRAWLSKAGRNGIFSLPPRAEVHGEPRSFPFVIERTRNKAKRRVTQVYPFPVGGPISFMQSLFFLTRYPFLFLSLVSPIAHFHRLALLNSVIDKASHLRTSHPFFLTLPPSIARKKKYEKAHGNETTRHFPKALSLNRLRKKYCSLEHHIPDAFYTSTFSRSTHTHTQTQTRSVVNAELLLRCDVASSFRKSAGCKNNLTD